MEMGSQKLTVVVEPDDEGFFAWCPELEGCHSQGVTASAALAGIQHAIQLYIADVGVWSRSGYDPAVSIDNLWVEAMPTARRWTSADANFALIASDFRMQRTGGGHLLFVRGGDRIVIPSEPSIRLHPKLSKRVVDAIQRPY